VSSACGGAAREPEPTTGVRGAVVAEPECPVQTDGSPCPPIPLRGVTVRATTGAGALAGTAVTDRDGRFELSLRPGGYTLVPVLEGAGPPFATPQAVTVPRTGFAQVTLVVDTGIRAPVATS
jgi:hypothetical protein